MSDCGTRCNDQTACPHAEQAAEKAVNKMFERLGVDCDDPKELRKFQEGLWFGQRLKTIVDKGVVTAVGALIVLIVGAVWLSLKLKITGSAE